ncbi:uncharacterized protein LOC113467560 [Diaphorina citri]|uniref:Uncharacterized protein LOC113467560 n=1 Tax=Diaphorina citri TaxID=121845 RepID=A0A3Q0ITL1_DIACI|nr:uncharacterized protein LOC113467560 [Diaphorina citri]
MSDPEALKLKAFLETYNLTFLHEQLLEQEADLEFLLGANDEELSSIVPKVVHKAKLRNAIAKLKAESGRSGSLEPSTTNQQFQCPTSQVQQHVIEPSTSQLVLSNPLTTHFENFEPSFSSTFGQYESVSQPVVNQATTSEVITVPEANNSINPLQKVLQSSATGTTILQKTDLDKLDRRFITSAIVETCLLKVKKPSDTIRGEEWTKWTTYIKEIFPKEDPTMYYTPFKVSDGKCFRATGYIANRLIHIRRSISTHVRSWSTSSETIV